MGFLLPARRAIVRGTPADDIQRVSNVGSASNWPIKLYAGDQYTGADRFGRVVDQRWIVASSGTATDRFKFG